MRPGSVLSLERGFGLLALTGGAGVLVLPEDFVPTVLLILLALLLSCLVMEVLPAGFFSADFAGCTGAFLASLTGVLAGAGFGGAAFGFAGAGLAFLAAGAAAGLGLLAFDAGAAFLTGFLAAGFCAGFFAFAFTDGLAVVFFAISGSLRS